MHASSHVSLSDLSDSELLSAARVSAIERDGELIVRLRGFTPLMAAMAVIAVSVVLCMFGYAIWGIFTGQSQLPQGAIIAVVTITLGLALGFAWRRHVAISTGDEDLVIDLRRKRLKLPRTFGRELQVELSLDRVTAVDLAYGQAAEEYSMDDLNRRRRMNVDHDGSPRDVGHRSDMCYFPLIVSRDDVGAEQTSFLVKWTDLYRARAFAAWLDRKITDLIS